MGLDRPVLKRTDGLDFFKLMGTGRGETMTLSADLKRWSLFAVWRDAAALDAFLVGSEVVYRWDALAAEAYHVRLAPLKAHGAWSGRRPFGDGPWEADAGGPVAVLTRAAIRPTRLRAFYGAISGPAIDLHEQPGRLASVGVGEWPFARQATFSMWRSFQDVRAYAYGRPAHRDVIRRTREEDWYSEELFARFRPFGAQGTWGGSDPLTSIR